MKRLLDAPNIGPVLENNLNQIGIKTLEQLRSSSSKDIFIKIRKIDSGACLHMLYGLEGAIENIKDSELSKSTKDDLKNFYNSLDKEEDI